MFGYVNDLVGIEIQAHHSIVALRLLGFLLYADAVALFIELGHAVTLGVGDPIAKHSGFVFFFGSTYCILKHLGETIAVEDVVAQNETSAVVADELLTDDEGLGQTIGGGLFGVFEMDTIIGAVAQKTLEARQVIWRADNQDVADARKHQSTDGIIHHRLVVDGEQLLAHSLGDGIEAGS